MLKLYGSELEVSSGTVLAENGNGATEPERCGAVSFVSNKSGSIDDLALPTLAPTLITGSTTAEDWIKRPSFFDAAVRVPVLPRLKGGYAAVAGFCAGGDESWNAISADVPEMVVNGCEIRRAPSKFAGFDQLFASNPGDLEAAGCRLRIGTTALMLPTLPPGGVWTTCVRTGSEVKE